jgi:hypothetical protein
MPESFTLPIRGAFQIVNGLVTLSLLNSVLYFDSCFLRLPHHVGSAAFAWER